MINYFTDPVLKAPTIGSMLMCFIAAFVGTFSVLKKRSLVGEAISHASYPGVICSLLLGQMFFEGQWWQELLIPLIGAAISSLLGMFFIQKLTTKYRVASDSALCFIVASFFGFSLVILTGLQARFPALYRQLQAYLFGQAATQTMANVYVYTILVVASFALMLVYYRHIKAVIFDPDYALAIGINVDKINAILLAITVLAVVIGIRSLGVVLLSSMLIFPAVASRLWTSRLEYVLLFAGLFGLLSGFFGVVLSHEMSGALSFPTGPMIVLVAAAIFLFSIFFSPGRGLFFRIVRQASFRTHCQQENLLKVIYKLSRTKNRAEIAVNEIASHFQCKALRLKLLLWSLQKRGWVKSKDADYYELTASGLLWGRKIIQLHRLWEVYLVEVYGLAKERAHPSAEEMEHIITPEIQKRLEKELVLGGAL